MSPKEFILGFIMVYAMMFGIILIPKYLKEGIKQIIREIKNKD